MKQSMQRTILWCVLTSCTPLGCSARMTYANTRADLLRRSAADPRLPLMAPVERLWPLAARSVCEFLDAHPRAKPAEIIAILPKVPDRPASVVQLTPTAYVIAMAEDVGFGVGTVFIVANDARDRRYRLAWQIGPHPWTYTGNEEGATFVGTVYALPALADGRARFFIDGYAVGAVGGSHAGQLSVWNWDGGNATAVLTETYGNSITGEHRVSFADGLIHVSTREYPDSFYTCEECAEPLGDLQVRLTPTGVEGPVHLYAVPEMHTIDALFTRLKHGDSATELAAPGVIATLVDQLIGNDATSHEFHEPLEEFRVKRSGAATSACVRLQGRPPYEFEIISQQNRKFVDAVNVHDGECEK